jgi:hypothetical protein
MRLKDYGRNPAKRKEYVSQKGLLLVGIDISKAKHDACIDTLPGGKSKTDKKDVHSIFDLLCQGKFLLPVVRDPDLQAAYRMMQPHMGCWLFGWVGPQQLFDYSDVMFQKIGILNLHVF